MKKLFWLVMIVPFLGNCKGEYKKPQKEEPATSFLSYREGDTVKKKEKKDIKTKDTIKRRDTIEEVEAKVNPQ